MPLISVIVPVFRTEKFLHSCVESILSQTFSDFELLLVNDGSPDGSGAICDAYAEAYPFITAIHQTNQGQAAARNHALRKARGNWICFVDSDDVIHPNMLEYLYQAAVQSGAGISMCRYIEAPELPERFFQGRELVFDVLSVDEKTLTELYDREEYPGWVACTKLIRREWIEAYPFREGRVFEDNEAVCRWICAAGKLAWIDQELYYYRTNQGSTTKSIFSLKKLDYLWALNSITRFYDSIGYLQMRQRFADRYADAAYSACMGLRYELERPELIPGVVKELKCCFRQTGQKLTNRQRESLLEAAHPEWMPIYWSLAAAARTLKEQGLSGLVGKLMHKVRREESQ